MRSHSTRTIFFFTSIVISIFFAVFITFFFSSSMKSLLKQREEDYIERCQSQALSILQYDGEKLSVSLRDWASKQDIHNYVGRLSANDKTSILNINSVFLMRLNYAAIIAKNGLVSERYFDHENKTELYSVPYSDSLRTVSKWLYRETQLRYNRVGTGKDLLDTYSQTQMSGFVSAGGHVFFFAAAPILTPENDKESNGTLVFARLIEDEHLLSNSTFNKADSNDTKISISVPPLGDVKGEYGKVSYTDDGDGIMLQSVIPALDDSIILLSATQNRSIYKEGLAIIKILSALVFLFSCALSAVLMYTMEVSLVKPISILSNRVAGIDYDSPSIELPSFRGRELNILSTSIGTLLRRVGDHKVYIEEQNKRLSLQNQMLDALANYDSHTNLPNRHKLKSILAERIYDVKDRGGVLGLMYIDIANMRLINDARGQATGDMLLIAIANRLNSTFGMSNENVVACFGHENFAVLIAGHDRDDVMMAAYSLLTLFNDPYTIEDHEIVVNAAIGITVAPFDGESFEELDACANIAMNNARDSSDSSSFLFFDRKQLETVISKYNRIADIKRGLERGEFKVVFQPKVDMDTNLITSAEALVRWHSAASGVIPPSIFIPDACETGLIVPLSWEILRMSFDSNKRFSAELDAEFSVGVNVPNNVLLHSDFIMVLSDLLSDTQMSPSQLNVELTEDVLVNDMKKCNDRMNSLQEMGIQISIDDFGTGYASLQYLSKMPFNWMKIDKTFVDGLPDKQEEMAIIAASVGIARGIGMKVVLEGVETMKQWRMIAEQKYCDQIQGYVVSKPLPEEDFIKFVSEWNSNNGGSYKREPLNNYSVMS